MFAAHIMGCIFCKFFKKSTNNGDESRLVSADGKKEYSWDKKPKVNPKDYTVENLVDAEVIREPNTVNGRQFIIQNCSNSRIFVLDHCNSVTIDDCSDCQIVLGPITGSLFVRGSENVTLVALCGQFRARDCRNINAFLCCTSQPSIEACSKFDFGCALIQYKGIENHIGKSGLSLFNNQWNLIYDFTPVPSEGLNWQLIPAELVIRLVNVDVFRHNELALVLGEQKRSVVPHTRGAITDKKSGAAVENCFVAISQCSNQTGLALEFIASLKQMENVCLLQSKETKIDKEDAQKMFQKLKKIDDSEVNVIGLQFQGNNTTARCQQIAGEIINRHSSETESKIYISGDNSEALVHINAFLCTR